MDRDIKLIQDALAKEGRIVGDQMVVPDDFFERLNRALNPPSQRSIIDMIVNADRTEN